MEYALAQFALIQKATPTVYRQATGGDRVALNRVNTLVKLLISIDDELAMIIAGDSAADDLQPGVHYRQQSDPYFIVLHVRNNGTYLTGGVTRGGETMYLALAKLKMKLCRMAASERFARLLCGTGGVSFAVRAGRTDPNTGLCETRIRASSED